MKRLFNSMLIRARHHLREKEDVRTELRRAKLILQANLYAIIAIGIFIITDSLYGLRVNVIVDIIAFFGFIFGTYLLYKGHITYPKVNIIIICNLVMLLNASRDGRFAGNQFIWFPIVSSVFLFFSSEQSKYIIVCIIMTILSIIFLEATSYSALAKTSPNPEYLYLNYLTCLIVSMGLLMVYLKAMLKTNGESEKKLLFYNARLKRKNARLRSLNEELDGYIYKTTHDLRAPLNSILGIIEICKNESDLNTIKSFVQLQEVSVRKLDSYIVDVLNLSKNTRLEIQLKEINLAELIHEIFHQLEHMESQASIHRDVQVHQYSKFYSDPHRLSMILSNLISNAIRYRDMTKNTQNVTVTAEVKPDKLYIVVKDNGLGIHKEYQDKIFDMFFRASEKVMGSGLGLYIVKEAVQKLGGKISLKSKPGVGSTFTVEIPNGKTEK